MRWRAQLGGRLVTDPVLPGTCCIGLPDDSGTVQYGDAHADFVHLHLDMKRMRELLLPDGIDFDAIEFIDPRNAADPEIDRIARQVVQIMPEGPTTRLRLDAAALALTAAMIERWSNLSPRPRHTGIAARSDWRIRRVIEAIEATIEADWGLDELATITGLSPAHCVRLFRQTTGQSPHAWLMTRRIQRACTMLGEPRRSITEIAHALGFASSQHFATSFQRHMGTTPSAWRASRRS